MSSDAAAALVAKGQQRVSELRLRMLSQYPFWGYLLADLRILWAPELPTLAATDGVTRIWLNPSAIAHLNRKQLGFVLMHEACHVIQETIQREQTRVRAVWNQATDYAINRQISHMPSKGGAAGSRAWQVPSGDIPGLGRCDPLLDARFDHLPAETIYERLLDQPSLVGAVGEPVNVQDERGMTRTSAPNHGGGIDVHVPLGGPEQFQDEERQHDERHQAELRLQQAAAAVHRRHFGENLPLGVERWLEELRRPAVPWQVMLQTYLHEFGASCERSWARPHKRWLVQDVLVPGPVPQGDGVVVLAVDTSGSMDGEQLQTIASELGALDACISELWVVCADASVHEVIAPGAAAEFLAKRRWKGGGGTDHRPVFAWVAEQQWVADLMICYTDLFTVVPKTAPRYPVLWLGAPDAQGRCGARPGFGDTIVLRQSQRSA